MGGYSFNRRSSRRMFRRHDAWLLIGNHVVHVRVANVSREGVGIVIDRDQVLPELIGIALVPGGEPQCARVAWCKGEDAGLSFADANY